MLGDTVSSSAHRCFRLRVFQTVVSAKFGCPEYHVCAIIHAASICVRSTKSQWQENEENEIAFNWMSDNQQCEDLLWNLVHYISLQATPTDGGFRVILACILEHGGEDLEIRAVPRIAKFDNKSTAQPYKWFVHRFPRGAFSDFPQFCGTCLLASSLMSDSRKGLRSMSWGDFNAALNLPIQTTWRDVEERYFYGPMLVGSSFREWKVLNSRQKCDGTLPSPERPVEFLFDCRSWPGRPERQLLPCVLLQSDGEFFVVTVKGERPHKP